MNQNRRNLRSPRLPKSLVKSSLRISWKGNSDISIYEISKLWWRWPSAIFHLSAYQTIPNPTQHSIISQTASNNSEVTLLDQSLTKSDNLRDPDPKKPQIPYSERMKLWNCIVYQKYFWFKKWQDQTGFTLVDALLTNWLSINNGHLFQDTNSGSYFSMVIKWRSLLIITAPLT